MNRFSLALPLAFAMTACIPVPVSVPGPTVATATPAAQGSGEQLVFSGGVQSLGTAESRALTPLLRNAQGGPVTAPLSWSSSAPAVASVDANGLVKAVGRGSATIVVSLLTDPAVRAEIPIEVGTNRTSIAVRVTPASPAIAVGERVTLHGEVQLADGQIKADIAWTSSDNTIAVVNPTTGEVNGLAEGRVTITGAYASDPTYKALAEVRVVKDASSLPSATPSTVIFKPGGEGGDSGFDGSDGWTRDAFKTDQSVAAFSMIDSRSGVAVGGGGRLYVTGDGGVTWDAIPSPALLGLDLTDVDFVDTQNGYLVARTNRVWATHDGGANWAPQLPLNDATGNPVSLSQVAFASAQVGYACGIGSVFKTSDGGATWGRVETPSTVHVEALALGGGKLFLLGEQNVYAYADGAWTSQLLLLSPNTLDASFKRRMASFVSATTGWVTGAMGEPTVSRSTDGGKHWESVAVHPAGGGAFDASTGITASGTLSTIAFADADTGVMTTAGAAYTTADGGESWSRKALGGYVVTQSQPLGTHDFYMLGLASTQLPAGQPFSVFLHYDGR